MNLQKLINWTKTRFFLNIDAGIGGADSKKVKEQKRKKHADELAEKIGFICNIKKLKGVNLPEVGNLTVIFSGTYDKCFDRYNMLVDNWVVQALKVGEHKHYLLIDYSNMKYFILPEIYIDFYE